MIIYVGILSLVSAVVVSMLLSFAVSYRNVTALRLAENSGFYSMERMIRDIISATSVDSGNSTFGVSPGVLTIVSTYNAVSTTTKFYVDNGLLKVDINGSYFGPLNSTNTIITNLVFTRLVNNFSNAIKIDLTVRGTAGEIMKDKIYHSTVILRGAN